MKIATTAVIFKDGEVLIGRRLRDNRWELPGGRLDPGESPEDCVRREIKEELDLEVRIIRYLGTLEGTYRGIPMKVFAFLTTCDAPGPVRLSAHKEVRWIVPRQYCAFDIVEEDRVVLQRLLGSPG